MLAIGNPFGFGGTVTAGIISARGRDINAGPYDDFLQTDASINRGNSGGPMFNLDGEVVGINTAIFSPSGGSIGIGFAIPSNSAQPVIQQLIEHGEVRRGWLGVRIQAVTEEIADALGLKEAAGALVAERHPRRSGGEGEAIKDGDVIVEFDGKPVTQMRRLPRLVADTEVGRTVPIKVWRDGKEMTLKVEVGALEETEEKVAAQTPGPETPSRGEKIEGLGLDVAAIDDRCASASASSADAKGVVITTIDSDGPAAEQGVRVGDRIVEVAQETGVDARRNSRRRSRRREAPAARRCCCWSKAKAACASSPSSPATRAEPDVRRGGRRCSSRSRRCGRRPEQAAAVAARPYDVLSFAEAKAGAEGRPWSFLHVSRAEIDLPAGTDPHAPEVYATGRATLRR